MVCPNHDDTQICPDCTYRPPPLRPEVARSWIGQGQGTFPNSLPALPPLEQHKADLEMIIAACVTGADKTGEAACTAIAKLANGMLLRIDGHTVVDGKCSCVSKSSCAPYVADVTRRVLRLRCTCGWRSTAHTPSEAEATMTEHKS